VALFIGIKIYTFGKSGCVTIGVFLVCYFISGGLSSFFWDRVVLGIGI